MCIFKKNKTSATIKSRMEEEARQKFDKMWDLWAEGKIPSPYADLMTYQSEVNNGGHDQFFLNVESTGHLRAVMAELRKILPLDIRMPLVEAYNARKVNGKDAEETQTFYEHADDVFFKKEELINKVLEKYSKKIEL
jgi:hypothetical protein